EYVRKPCHPSYIDEHLYLHVTFISTPINMKRLGMTITHRPRMSFLDRFLPVWIILAMVAGLFLGRSIPGLSTALGSLEVGGISLPVAFAIRVKMYPPLATVRYDKTRA